MTETNKQAKEDFYLAGVSIVSSINPPLLN